MPAHEREHLRKPVDLIGLAAVEAGLLAGFHLQHQAGDILLRYGGSALVADKPSSSMIPRCTRSGQVRDRSGGEGGGALVKERKRAASYKPEAGQSRR
jgi:hypothetical protein